jgi:hypothetical protein
MSAAIDFAGILAQSRKNSTASSSFIIEKKKEEEGPNKPFIRKAKEIVPEKVPTFSKNRTLESANKFLLAVKQAGKRQNACGIAKVIPQEVRNDEALAIKEFTGEYSRGIAHGLQIDFARNEARRIVSTGVRTPVQEYSRCSRATGGHAFGMPNTIERERMALKGQERLAVQALCEGQKGAEVQLRTIRELIDNLSY